MTDRGVVRQDGAASFEEAHLWDVLEQAPVGYQSLDADGRVLVVNAAWLAMLGYDREDVVGRWFGDLVADGQGTAFGDCFAAFVDAGTVDAELELRRADGSVLPARISGRVARDDSGRFLRTHCFVDDLAERRRVEARLLAREEQLQAVLDHSPFGMHTYRLEGDRLVFSGSNETAGRMLGIDHAALLGMTLEEAFPGNTGTETAAAYHRIAREGGSYEALDYAYDAEGIAGVFEIHAFAYGAGQVAVFFRDVTEPRRLEAAVRESEKRYRTLFENAQEGLAVCRVVRDGQGEPVDWVYLQVNAEFTRIAGGVDAVGRSWRELFPERAREAPGLPRRYARVADEGGALDFESYVVSLGRWLRIAVFRLAPDTFVLAMEDITQRKRSEMELEERERMLSTLLGNLPGMAYRCRNDDGWTDEFVSAGAEELLGHSAEAVVGGTAPSLMAMMHPDDIERVRTETDEALARDRHWVYTYRVVDAGGTLKWVTERGTGVRDESGAVVALEGFIEDVTAQHAADERLRESFERLEAVTEGAIATLARAVEIRDPYTAGHQRRVSRLAVEMAVRLGLDDERVRGVHMAALVHDVGKIVVPAEILAKPGRLTEMEMALIRHHSREGHDLLAGIDCPWPLAAVALQHHERIDGSGYPSGLRGDEVLLEARIIAVADVVEAMASDRPYRPALGVGAAVAEIRGARGVTLDADACAVCLDILADGFEFDD